MKSCEPVPCPEFEDATLDVERCPTCGSPELKWSRTQSFSCPDEFHNYGLTDVIADVQTCARQLRETYRLPADVRIDVVLPDWLAAQATARYGTLESAADQVFNPGTVRLVSASEAYGSEDESED